MPLVTKLILILTDALLILSGCTIDEKIVDNSKPQPTVHYLFINEFMASNVAAFADKHGNYGDWVEIYNAGTNEIDLGGYYLTDSHYADGDSAWYLIPATAPDSTTVPAGGYLIFWFDSSPQSGVRHVNQSLSKKGDAIYLIDAQQSIVDSIVFGAQKTDTSYARVTDGGDTWTFLYPATPGQSNSEEPPGKLVINEFMASNDAAFADEFGGFDDWIELYNGKSQAVDVAGMYVTDDLTNLTLFQIPDTDHQKTTIPAKGYLVLWADKEPDQGVLHLNLKLSGSGEQIGLIEADGVTVVDSLTYSAQEADKSFGRLPDGSNNWVVFDPATPGASNQ